VRGEGKVEEGAGLLVHRGVVQITRALALPHGVY
jgi:hypothetical protein